MTTKRCNAEERKAPVFQPGEITQGEPALGTLSERLDIIIRRHGGYTRTPKPQPWEREMFPVVSWTEHDEITERAS